VSAAGEARSGNGSALQEYVVRDTVHRDCIHSASSPVTTFPVEGGERTVIADNAIAKPGSQRRFVDIVFMVMQLQGFDSWFCIAHPVDYGRHLSASVRQNGFLPWYLHARRLRAGDELYRGPICALQHTAPVEGVMITTEDMVALAAQGNNNALSIPGDRVLR
jgi:hypothetical protein